MTQPESKDEIAPPQVLDYDDALVEARQYLYSSQPPHDHVWLLDQGQRVADGWFFWQSFEPKRLIKDPEARFGGGPVAFTVRDDRSILTHGMLNLPPEITMPANRSTASRE